MLLRKTCAGPHGSGFSPVQAVGAAAQRHFAQSGKLHDGKAVRRLSPPADQLGGLHVQKRYLVRSIEYRIGNFGKN